VKARRKKALRGVRKDPSVVLIEAVRVYARALKRQHKASTELHRALSRGKDGEALDLKHGAACDARDVAEHALLVCAAIVGGWSRKGAEKSV
jgi:hypothetical protein